METLSPTRTELLGQRRRAALAEQGRDLLKDKRAALVRAFQERTALLLRRLEELRRAAADARARLDEARAVLGPAAVESASFAAAGRVAVAVHSSMVAGVVVVDVEHDDVRRAPTERGFALALADADVDVVAAAYEQEVAEVLELAPLELSVRRLAEEIARTTRQVNALEYVVVPRLRTGARRIELLLDEREREETARLKRARTRARERASSDGAGSSAGSTVAAPPELPPIPRPGPPAAPAPAPHQPRPRTSTGRTR